MTEIDLTPEGMKKHIAEINEQLAALAKMSVNREQMIRDRTDGRSYVEKPPTMSNQQLSLEAARQAKAENAMVSFPKDFRTARPDDGAVALTKVLAEIYGFSPIGEEIVSFFGVQRPEIKTLQLGWDRETGRRKEIKVPWGLMSFGPLEANLTLQIGLDKDFGPFFQVYVEAPKRMEDQLDAIFEKVEEYLKHNSIYANQALEGVGEANQQLREIIQPRFFEGLHKLDTTKLVWDKATWNQLDIHVLARMNYTEAHREEEIPLGAKVLLFGDNGTGKTVFAMMAAIIAILRGWGAIFVRPDEDLEAVVNFGKNLPHPVLMVMEDCEKLLLGVDPKKHSKEIDRILNLFDGASAKGREVLLVMTTNHIDELRRSMLRPGRIDVQIPVGNLDREGVEELIKVNVSADRREDLDFDVLHEAYAGFSPSFIVQSLHALKGAAIARTGKAGSKFVTEDFVAAADSLRPAWEQHRKATDRPEQNDPLRIFKQFVENAVGDALESRRVDIHENGDIVLVDA